MTTIVATCQTAPSVDNPDQSYSQIQSAIEQASNLGAHIAVLPELANSGYMFNDRHELENRAEAIPGETTALLENLAQRHRLVIVCGLAENDAGVLYNSAVLIDESGLRVCYRKAHLWDAERFLGYTPGRSGPAVVDTSCGRIGVMICYDQEFPEWVRLAALDRAELLCVPTNWPLQPRPDGERPNEVIRAQANASVNRMFIAVADRAGVERKQRWLGGSVIIDADGYPSSELNFGRECIMTATINLAEARDKAISPHNNVHADRRTELYQGIQS